MMSFSWQLVVLCILLNWKIYMFHVLLKHYMMKQMCLCTFFQCCEWVTSLVSYRVGARNSIGSRNMWQRLFLTEVVQFSTLYLVWAGHGPKSNLRRYKKDPQGHVPRKEVVFLKQSDGNVRERWLLLCILSNIARGTMDPWVDTITGVTLLEI